MGDKTKVEFVGVFKIQGLDEQTTRKAALAQLEQIFNEDMTIKLISRLILENSFAS
jgi:hypothetical protein